MIATRFRPLRPLIAWAAAATLAAIAVLALAAPASAHDQLLSSDPADGSTVAAMPAEVTLTFSSEVLAGSGNEVVVTDAAGTTLSDGPAAADGVTLVQPLTGEGSGAITVQWRAVSSDGHPVSGQFGFTAAAAPSPGPSTDPAASETPEPTMTAFAEPTPSPSEAPAEPDAVASPLPWIVGAVVVLVIVAVVVVLLVRPRRPGADTGTGSRPDAGR